MAAFVAPVVIVCILLAGLLTVGVAAGTAAGTYYVEQCDDREDDHRGRQGRENDHRGRRGRGNHRRRRRGRENDRNRHAGQPPEAGLQSNQQAEPPPQRPPPLGREVEDRRGDGRQLGGEMRRTHGPGAGGFTHGERVRYNAHGGEERDMEVMILAPPTAGCVCPIPPNTPRPGRARGGELTHRQNGGRVAGFNAHGRPISLPARPNLRGAEPAAQSRCGGMKDGACASASASLRPQSCFYETHAALSLAQEDPTLELRKFCGGNQTTREEHYMCMEQYIKNCEKDGAIIWFAGHGQQGTGDWVFLDGEITFMDVFGLYQNYFMGRKLTIVCDCCYSGHWVEKLAMKLDEYGIPPCGHRAKALDIKLQIVASCQKNQQCRERSFIHDALIFNEDGSINFPREMKLSDNQTTAHIDTTEIRCSSGVYGTCSIPASTKWQASLDTQG